MKCHLIFFSKVLDILVRYLYYYNKDRYLTISTHTGRKDYEYKK